MARFFVYAHILDGKVFYVGAGNIKRPWNKTCRSQKWLKFVGKRKSEILIAILHVVTDRQVALTLEGKAIDQCNPKCNIYRGGLKRWFLEK